MFFFFENRAVCEIMSKNMVEPEATNYVTIWRTRVSRWISKATRAYAHSHVHAPGHPRPGRFTPRERKRYPLCSRLGGPKGRSRLVRKISSPQGFDPRAVHFLFSRYTDWAIPAQLYLSYSF